MLHKIENKNHCYGITHCDGKLYYCHGKDGVRQFDMKTNTNELLVSTDIDHFSHISCNGNKLLYISDTKTVSCCDMNGNKSGHLMTLHFYAHRGVLSQITMASSLLLVNNLER